MTLLEGKYYEVVNGLGHYFGVGDRVIYTGEADYSTNPANYKFRLAGDAGMQWLRKNQVREYVPAQLDKARLQPMEPEGPMSNLLDGFPSDAAARKAIPIATGFIYYFPDAIAAVAELSRIGNDQHNPGKPLHWDRSKSGDESDALMRHFLQRGTRDSDGVLHSAKVAWRALAQLQKEIEDGQS